MPDFSASNSSIASSASSHTSVTPPLSAETLFDNVKPNQEAFEPASFGVKSKFKPRDSTGSNASHNSNSDDKLMPPPSVHRPTIQMPGSAVKRARSLGHRPPLETPIEPPTDLASKFDFVCQGVSSFAFGAGVADEKPAMPGTPVKRNNFGQNRRVVTSISQPVLGSDHAPVDYFSSRASMAIPGSARQPSAVPHLTLTTTSSPDSGMDTEDASPTNFLGSATKKTPGARLDLLRRKVTTSSSVDCSEDESTPTKGRGDRHILSCKRVRFDFYLHSASNTPSPSPKAPGMLSPCSMPKDVPRLSLPAFSAQKSRRVRHRQSHPAAPIVLPQEDDLFESRFVVRDSLGRGAFSTVLLVQERHGEGLFAVKKTRNVFDGVKDRLRQLEEIAVLRHLSQTPNAHVVKFVDAWEQNRQLYIQTEACVGSLAQFLEVFGHDNVRLDEGRVWKMARDVADGLRHIHSHGVIHFDIKTDNILVSQDRSLKIADFGLATRWPRISPQEIIAGSGLGGSIGLWTDSSEKLEREGDRVYMPPEMLNGVFVMAADIFSFGIVFLELALNVYLPDGGVHWRALRENDYSYVDMTTLSPPLVELITSCMQADPTKRPIIDRVASHPVLQRAAITGGPALAPEDESWLPGILADTGYLLPASTAAPSFAAAPAVDSEGDVVMADA
jgi:mitosis inhibitor protein kinase SWE1